MATNTTWSVVIYIRSKNVLDKFNKTDYIINMFTTNNNNHNGDNMKIHENQNSSNRSKSTCGYCRETGHNQYQCPHVKSDWENFLSRLEIPKDKNGQPIKRGYNYVTWNSSGFDPIKDDICNNALASWFRNCKKAYIEQKKRGFSKDHKKRGSATSRTCGFCGGKDHTRRNCTKMEQFLKDCYKANENWRRAAYKQLVEDGGLSVGACVEVMVPDGNYYGGSKIKKVGIIKSINWNTVNVLSSANKYSDFASSPLNVIVMIDGKDHKITNLHDKFSTIGENGKTPYYWGNSCDLAKVITHSPTPLPPEWITSYKESFDTLVKKRTYQQLQNGMKSEYRAPNLVAHINAWK